MTDPHPAGDVEREIAEHGVETVLCVVPDIWGRLVGKRVTVPTFLRTVLMDEGLHASLYLFVVDIDMDPRPGYPLSNWDSGFSDFRLVPDLATFRILPWLDRTAIVLCDACHEDSDELVAVAPRTILRRQVARARDAGLALKTASELEFYLFRESPQEAWRKRYDGLDPLSYYRADYHVLQSSKDDWFLGKLRRNLSQARCEVEFSKAEWGLGQQEVNLRYTDVLEMADRHVLYKNGVKEMAALDGMSATFMAKPWIDQVGSSFHIHASLWSADGARSLMWDATAPDHMAVSFRQFLAGQLAAARELAWFFAPTVNSYKRFQHASFAPTVVAWGIDNRTCGFRVVGHRESLRFENRIPGADANPYLAFAATLIAGLHGIERSLDCGDAHTGNAYEDLGLPAVWAWLGDSIAALADSSLAAEALGPEVFDHLLNFARQELTAFQHEAVTDWERVRYFERI